MSRPMLAGPEIEQFKRELIERTRDARAILGLRKTTENNGLAEILLDISKFPVIFQRLICIEGGGGPIIVAGFLGGHKDQQFQFPRRVRGQRAASGPTFATKDAGGRTLCLCARGVCLLMARAAKVSSIESLPLFATDDVIGAALLGNDRVQEWMAIAPMLEARGLPKADHLMGGRYVRAVVAFFDHLYGLDRSGDVPLAPDGVEDFDGWKRKQKHRG